MSENKSYAVIKTGGIQLRVEPGETVRVPLLTEANAGDKITMSEVMMIGGNDSEPIIGMPVVEGAKVEAVVLRHGKDKKIYAFKKKRRKGYKKKIGHRQDFSEVRIDSIQAGR